MSPWDKYIETALSLTEVPRKRAESIVKSLVRQGEVAAERAEKSVDELLKLSEANRRAVAAIVRTETEKAVGRLGLVRRSEVERLERQVAELRAEHGGGDAGTAEGEGDEPARSAARATAAKATAARAGAAAAKATGKKATSKKATSKKAATKKASAKKAAAKKSAAQRRAAATAAERTAEVAEQGTAARPNPDAKGEEA